MKELDVLWRALPDYQARMVRDMTPAFKDSVRAVHPLHGAYCTTADHPPHADGALDMCRRCAAWGCVVVRCAWRRVALCGFVAVRVVAWRCRVWLFACTSRPACQPRAGRGADSGLIIWSPCAQVEHAAAVDTWLADWGRARDQLIAVRVELAARRNTASLASHTPVPASCMHPGTGPALHVCRLGALMSCAVHVPTADRVLAVSWL